MFNYTGDPEATDVIVSMGSGAQVVNETIEYLQKQGRKVGAINVHLYRPFATDRFVAALPKTVKRIAVLDRTKEPGASGEPLFLDVQAAVARHNVQASVIGGRYGLAARDVIPADWATATDAPVTTKKEVPAYVTDICRPINTQNGYDLPVSAFKDYADGTLPVGMAAYEKRGVALTVPHWHKENCIQCNQCAYVCPHATIRPVLATADEVAAAPEGFETVPALGTKDLQFRIAVSPLTA